MKYFHMSFHGMLLGSLFFGVLPTSSNYGLNNYGFGSGGTSKSTSTNYSLNGTTGETSQTQATSTNYSVRSGNNNSQQAYVPAAPTFTNPANNYNKLKFIVIPGASPSDTKFTLAVSTDNFVTSKYVQLDGTLGNTKVYQTYTAWGGASGQFVGGLSISTTYKIRANAIQGDFTETEYGPASAGVATVAPSITYDIDTAATDIETAAPYAVSFVSLLPGTVVGSTQRIWLDIDTNAVSGASIYIRSLNAGLKSTKTNYTIASATADLTAAASGFGAQSMSATQTSGGPMTTASPYNGAGQNVGILDTSLRQIFSTTAPVTAGRVSMQIKAKASNTTPSSNDYGDTFTLTMAGLF